MTRTETTHIQRGHFRSILFTNSLFMYYIRLILIRPCLNFSPLHRCGSDFLVVYEGLSEAVPGCLRWNARGLTSFGMLGRSGYDNCCWKLNYFFQCPLDRYSCDMRRTKQDRFTFPCRVLLIPRVQILLWIWPVISHSVLVTSTNNNLRHHNS